MNRQTGSAFGEITTAWAVFADVTLGAGWYCVNAAVCDSRGAGQIAGSCNAERAGIPVSRIHSRILSLVFSALLPGDISSEPLVRELPPSGLVKALLE